MTGVTWPRPSRRVIATWPDSTTNMPGPGLPVSNSASPCFIGSQFPEPAHALDFVMRQRRERLLVTRKREGRAGRRTGRDVCTHYRHPKKKQEPCRERARPPGERSGFSLPLLARLFSAGVI